MPGWEVTAVVCALVVWLAWFAVELVRLGREGGGEAEPLGGDGWDLDGGRGGHGGADGGGGGQGGGGGDGG